MFLTGVTHQLLESQSMTEKCCDRCVLVHGDARWCMVVHGWYMVVHGDLLVMHGWCMDGSWMVHG